MEGFQIGEMLRVNGVDSQRSASFSLSFFLHIIGVRVVSQLSSAMRTRTCLPAATENLSTASCPLDPLYHLLARFSVLGTSNPRWIAMQAKQAIFVRSARSAASAPSPLW